MTGRDEISHGDWSRNHRHRRLKALLCRRHCDALQAVEPEGTPLGMLPNHWNYLIYTKFHSLFHKPLVAVDILRGADSHAQIVMMRPPACFFRHHPGDRFFRGIVRQCAVQEGPGTVDYGNRISGAMPQHPDAVGGVLRVEIREAVIHLMRIEKFHLRTYYLHFATQAEFDDLRSAPGRLALQHLRHDVIHR